MEFFRKHWKKIAGLIVVSLLVYVFIAFDLRNEFSQWFKNDVQTWLKANPVIAPFAYIGIYVTSVVAFMPGSVVTLAGGALFGPILGTIYASVASTIAAGIAFLVARYFAADWVEDKASGRLGTVKEGIEAEGWRFVAFTRLVPIFPYNLLNYMFGLTKISFWIYAGVSWLAMLPGTFAYVYTGFAAQKATAGGSGVRTTLIYISIALGLLVLVSMIPKLVKKMQDDDIEDIVEDEEEN